MPAVFFAVRTMERSHVIRPLFGYNYHTASKATFSCPTFPAQSAELNRKNTEHRWLTFSGSAEQSIFSHTVRAARRQSAQRTLRFFLNELCVVCGKEGSYFLDSAPPVF